jgi:hypothetical protein
MSWRAELIDEIDYTQTAEVVVLDEATTTKLAQAATQAVRGAKTRAIKAKAKALEAGDDAIPAQEAAAVQPALIVVFDADGTATPLAAYGTSQQVFHKPNHLPPPVPPAGLTATCYELFAFQVNPKYVYINVNGNCVWVKV